MTANAFHADTVRKSQQWQTPYAQTAAWIHYVNLNRYYCKSLLIESTYQGRRGVFVASSNAVSNATAARNQHAKVVLRPEYFDYDVWFHEGVVMLNFHGLSNFGILVGNFEAVLEGLCQTAGVPAWRVQFAPRVGEYHDCSLGRLLLQVGISVHMFIMGGLSFAEFRGVDLYCCIVHGADPPPEYYAYDVVVSAMHPMARPTNVRCEDWWYMPIRIAYGQASCQVHWLLSAGEDVNVLYCLADRYRHDPVATLQGIVSQTVMDPRGLVRLLVRIDDIVDPQRMVAHQSMMQPLHDRIMQIMNASTGIPLAIEDCQTAQDAEAVASRL